MAKGKKQTQVERDVMFLALINKAIEINTISANQSKSSVYRDVNTLLYNISVSIEDNLRMEHMEDELEEIDSSKFKNVKAKTKSSNGTNNGSSGTPTNPSSTDDDDDENNQEEDDDDGWLGDVDDEDELPFQ